MENYRSLTPSEIDILSRQGNTCADWSAVQVSPDFSPAHIFRTHFSGTLRLGASLTITDSTLSSSSNSHIVVNVLSEAGDRAVTIFPSLSSNIAYLQAFYRSTKLVECILRDTSPFMTIGDRVTIGPYCILRNTIVSSSSSVTDAAQLDHVFVGNNVKIGGGFSADHSLFFTGCEMFHGEACAYFAGPFSVSHHKNSLLIACMTSFFNAGSGTNFSNHLYKTGPVHYGILRRGCKMASNTHLVFPAHIAPFTTLFGEIPFLKDTSALPFSYLTPEGIKAGVNLFRCAYVRDQDKWRKRDKRAASEINDLIHFDALSPLTLQPIFKSFLADPKNRFYKAAIAHYLSLQSSAAPSLSLPNPLETSWTDIGGLITTANNVQSLLADVESGALSSLTDILQRLRHLHNAYEELNNAFAHALACQFLDVASFSPSQYADTLKSLASPLTKAVQHDFEIESLPPFSTFYDSLH